MISTSLNSNSILGIDLLDPWGENSCLTFYRGDSNSPTLRVQTTPYFTMPDIRGARVVFDVDGTLVDSEPALKAGVRASIDNLIRHTTDAHEFQLTDQQFELIVESCFGVSDDEMCRRVFRYLKNNSSGIPGFEKLCSHLSTVGIDEFVHSFTTMRLSLYADACDRSIEPMPGAIKLILALYERYGPLAINTGSHEDFAKLTIDRVLGKAIAEAMPGLTSEMVFPPHLRVYGNTLPAGIGSKPHPLGYQRAIALVRADSPSKDAPVIIFGDRANDSIAGLTAGAYLFIAIPERGEVTPFVKGSLAFTTYCSVMPHADASSLVIVRSMEDIVFAQPSFGFFSNSFFTGR